MLWRLSVVGRRISYRMAALHACEALKSCSCGRRPSWVVAGFIHLSRRGALAISPRMGVGAALLSFAAPGFGSYVVGATVENAAVGTAVVGVLSIALVAYIWRKRSDEGPI